jgi:hypothetical protein
MNSLDKVEPAESDELGGAHRMVGTPMPRRSTRGGVGSRARVDVAAVIRSGHRI